MNRRPLDVSAAVAPGKRGVVVLDGAGWHRSKDLEVPKNPALVRLPPCSPEPDPVERAFSFIKSNCVSNRMFDTVDDACRGIAGGWDKFRSDRDRIRSLGYRKWAVIHLDKS